MNIRFIYATGVLLYSISDITPKASLSKSYGYGDYVTMLLYCYVVYRISTQSLIVQIYGYGDCVMLRIP